MFVVIASLSACLTLAHAFEYNCDLAGTHASFPIGWKAKEQIARWIFHWTQSENMNFVRSAVGNESEETSVQDALLSSLNHAMVGAAVRGDPDLSLQEAVLSGELGEVANGFFSVVTNDGCHQLNWVRFEGIPAADGYPFLVDNHSLNAFPPFLRACCRRDASARAYAVTPIVEPLAAGGNGTQTTSSDLTVVIAHVVFSCLSYEDLAMELVHDARVEDEATLFSTAVLVFVIAIHMTLQSIILWRYQMFLELRFVTTIRGRHAAAN